MKVLVLSSTFPRWENDTIPPFVFLLTKELKKKGVEPIVLAPHYKNAKFKEEIDGIIIYRFPYFYPFSFEKLSYNGGIISNIKKNKIKVIEIPFFFLVELLYTIYLYYKYKPLVIHAHWLIPQGFIASIVRKIFKVRLILTIHGSDIFIFKKGITKHLINFILNNSDLVTVNSSATYNALIELKSNCKKVIIPMGIDINLFSPNKKDENLKKNLQIDGYFLLAIGRIVPLKGFKYIIEAMPKIINDFPNLKLVIIGDGPEKENLTRLASNLKISKNIIFLGQIKNSDLPKYYANADIFIGPSIKTADGAMEAFGIVFLEALSSGTPVISTNVGGISDIIKNDFTGIVVKEKSSEDIYNSVKKILNDQNLRLKLSNNGQKYVQENYSWNKVSNDFLNEYKIIIK